MKKTLLLLFIFLPILLKAQFEVKQNKPFFYLDSKLAISAPEEGLWSVANQWENDWPTNWKHANPTAMEQVGDWTILKGAIEFPAGALLLRDSYRKLPNGLVQCIRRFEWTGEKPLEQATLSVRFQVKGKSLQPLLPGILYYGNSMGAKVNPDIIPVYTGQPGEFAIFEDHQSTRKSM